MSNKRVAKFYDYVTVTPVGVKVPDSTSDKVKFIDGILTSGQGVLVQTIAQHAARKTRNHAMYLPNKINSGRLSMLSRARGGSAGYDKPVLRNHDDGAGSAFAPKSEGRVLGRAISNEFIDYGIKPSGLSDSVRKNYTALADSTESRPMWSYIDVIDELNSIGLFSSPDWRGTGHLEVSALITDPDAVAQILDGRYMTVSTGMTSDRAICSDADCHQDWVSSGPCEHKPGKDGCFLIAGDLRYEEAFSFVVNPGDDEAVVSNFRIIDLPNRTTEGYTTYHANNIKTDNQIYELQASFVDSIRSEVIMKESTTLNETVSKEDQANSEEIKTTEKSVMLEDAVTNEEVAIEITATEPSETVAAKKEPSLVLEDATVSNIVSELCKHPADQVVEHLIPSFSDSASLRAIYDATVKACNSREIELPVIDSYISINQYETAVTAIDNLKVELGEERDSKKFLRLELKDFYSQNSRITDERDSALATNHEVLSEYTALLRLAENRDQTFDQLKAEQVEKTVLELESEFNDLRTRFEFDKIVLRPDGTSGSVQETIEDPVLSGAGSTSEPVVIEDKIEQEKKKYNQYIERYLYLSEYRGKTEAETYLHNIKTVGFVPRDLEIDTYVNENNDINNTNGNTNVEGVN
jgi:hypothetical protein